ncbi:MAG: hypothetical protein PHO27_00885 [Sulfuricurvum sp.]|nr:hypothetical protein [Sulfuricurvum sp.]
MIYTALLLLHSWFRWVVVISLIYLIVRAFRGWKGQKPFLSYDNTLRHSVATFAHIQLLFGIGLYFTSPISGYFMTHFKEAVHIREIRFFGLEHSITMLLAIFVITLGSMIAKRQKADNSKFRTIVVWYTIALLLILAAIPWEFSPIISRPFFRF